MEHWQNDADKRKSIHRNPVSVPLTHYETYMDWPGIEPRPPQ